MNDEGMMDQFEAQREARGALAHYIQFDERESRAWAARTARRRSRRRISKTFLKFSEIPF